MGHEDDEDEKEYNPIITIRLNRKSYHVNYCELKTRNLWPDLSFISQTKSNSTTAAAESVQTSNKTSTTITIIHVI